MKAVMLHPTKSLKPLKWLYVKVLTVAAPVLESTLAVQSPEEAMKMADTRASNMTPKWSRRLTTLDPFGGGGSGRGGGGGWW
jgi:hypothetical protein